jgi:hypothetical protein
MYCQYKMFLVRSVLLIFLFSFLCCVSFFHVLIVLFVFVRFIVCQMLRVSLDCPSLIIPSVFSVVYSHAYANADRIIDEQYGPHQKPELNPGPRRITM